ncbi:hypothetical protein LYZ41_00760 [Elizabethkingia miricola]|nr:hypothetical protein [Elizabethkingia miricola]UIO96624.1 hypothetical protein LYZ41_00760 [Elizabethkingia miricola]
MMKNIEWKYLKGLNQLYTEKKTKLKILNNSYINQILFKQKKLIKYQDGNHSIIEANPRYSQFYEQEFLDTYNYYNAFFEQSGIENNAKKTFTEEDLKALIFIYYNKTELRNNLTTQKKFSAKVFKYENSKYLENKPSLKNAVLQLLEIEEFPEKDPKNQQWRFVVDCPTPKAVVLCENLDCLKVPIEYKKNNIELWYVGGQNTKPLIDIPSEKLQLPLYYFCDWDYSGLSIYSQIKEIFDTKAKSIEIIQPLSNTKRLPVSVKHHKSKWKKAEFSNLRKNDFTESQIELIDELISNDEWIEEESIDLIQLLSEI